MAISTWYGNLSNYLVNPTENDHYGSGFGGQGAGRIPTELTWCPLLQGLGNITGFVESGFAVPDSGSLTNTISAGTAVICGHRVTGTSTISVTFGSSKTTYVFLGLEVDGAGKVVRPVIYLDDGGSFAIPDRSIPLGSVTTGGTISSAVDLRCRNQWVIGQVRGSDSSFDFGHASTHPGTGNWTGSIVSSKTRITFETPYHRPALIVSITTADPPLVHFGKTTSSSYTDLNAIAVDELFLIYG